MGIFTKFLMEEAAVALFLEFFFLGGMMIL